MPHACALFAIGLVVGWTLREIAHTIDKVLKD